MQTNTTSPKLASTLADISKLDQGTLVFLTVQKKGVERGKGGNKKVYGDDVVSVLVWSGFDYKALIERSAKKLTELEETGTLITTLTQEVLDQGCHDVTVADTCAALQETRASLDKVLQDTTGTAGVDDPQVFEPLVVNGAKVRGSKVYIGKGGDSPRAPKPGTLYIDGVKLGEVVVMPARNGRWNTTRRPKTIAKDTLGAKLPRGLYVRYALPPERVIEMKIDGEASAAAVAAGLPIDPESIRSLFKVAS